LPAGVKVFLLLFSLCFSGFFYFLLFWLPFSIHVCASVHVCTLFNFRFVRFFVAPGGGQNELSGLNGSISIPPPLPPFASTLSYANGLGSSAAKCGTMLLPQTKQNKTKKLSTHNSSSRAC